MDVIRITLFNGHSQETFALFSRHFPEIFFVVRCLVNQFVWMSKVLTNKWIEHIFMFDCWFHTKMSWIKRKSNTSCAVQVFVHWRRAQDLEITTDNSSHMNINLFGFFSVCIYSSLNILYLALYENDVYNKVYFLAWSFVQTSGAYPGLIPLQTHCKKELVQKQTHSLAHRSNGCK